MEDIESELQQRCNGKSCQHTRQEGEAPQLLDPLLLCKFEQSALTKGSVCILLLCQPMLKSMPIYRSTIVISFAFIRSIGLRACQVTETFNSGQPCHEANRVSMPALQERTLVLQGLTSSILVLLTKRCQRYRAFFSSRCSMISALHAGSPDLTEKSKA